MTTKKTVSKKVASKNTEENAVEEIEKVVEVPSAVEPYHVYDGQTKVSSRRQVFEVPASASYAVVENAGGGDLYVGVNSIEFTESNLLRVGETKRIESNETFYVGALSCPKFRISYYK